MGDARTEAIEAVCSRALEAGRRTGTTAAEHYGSLLDAIPPDVLARYAIERGALQQVGWHWREATFGSPVTHHWKPSQGEPAVPVYRLTTTEGAPQ